MLWRIEPGPDPSARAIDVGFGVTAVAYGAGAVWVTNVVRDEIVRIDARTNKVTTRIPLAGTPPSVAAADDTAWVSIAGAPQGETLPASACGPVVARARRPDVLIVSDLPLQAGRPLPRHGRRHPLRPARAEIQRRRTHRRLPVLRRLDGTDGSRLHQVCPRNYVRVIAPEDFHAAGAAVLAQQFGLRRLYVLKSTAESPGDPIATQFKRAARELGLTIAGSAEWDPEAKSYSAPAGRVARARLDGVYFADLYFENPDAVLGALRGRLGPKVVLSRANESLGPAGQRFLRDFAATQPGGTVPPALYIPEAAQAAEVLLEAIERSDGTRASVTRELRRLEVEDGILGSFRFDQNGDMAPSSITVLRVTGGKGDADLPYPFGDAVFDRVVRVPATLVGP